MYKCTIIGISDSHQLWFKPEILNIIKQGKVFSGGKRHHELVKEILPQGAEWIDVTVPLKNVFNQYEQYDDIVVFASGDPLFYGLATTLKREFPNIIMSIYPTFNSLQTLAHKLCLPYHNMRTISLTGRSWNKFDEALICGEELIGCLTDKQKNPQTIMQRMLYYGFDNYTMYVGENLGNEEKEHVETYVAGKEYDCPNCLILKRTRRIDKRFGIPDTEFNLLDGRIKMITKMPIRLATIAALCLNNKESLWDIGFCTGSVSIESKLSNPHLNITAFEIRQEGKNLMDMNSRKFHVPGINAVIGDFVTLDINNIPQPDAVFIGGYGGKMNEIIHKVHAKLKPGGCIVFNSVSKQSREQFISLTTELGMNTIIYHTITVDENNPITILKAE